MSFDQLTADIIRQIRDKDAEIERLRAEVEALRANLQSMIDLAEFWICRADLRGMSEDEFRTWHSLGYGSNAMRDARAAINAARQA